MHKKGIYERFLKRPFDFFVSLIALIILSPLMLLITILIKIKLGSPVLFIQKRIGKDQNTFNMYKFRSMSQKTNDKGELLPDSERLTKFGKFLRSTSIDELPALFNILLGKMSIVGPRPLPIVYIPYIKDHEKIRHNVKGGLTGLAQINGRNNTTWDNRFNLDVKYVNTLCFKNDINILFKTILVVIKRKNVGVRGIDSIVDLDIERTNMIKMESGDVL